MSLTRCSIAGRKGGGRGEGGGGKGGGGGCLDDNSNGPSWGRASASA